ncbi:MAG: tRNA pseudouridine(38-40) synthase TruA [Bdellovibrionota bacterium]
MNYYRAKIQYDGTDYTGFQWQKDRPSIQRDFNQALEKITGATFTTMGASRTDSGVHAFEQYIKITSQDEMNPEEMVSRLNKTLAPEIRCLEFIPSHKQFKPTNDCLSKEYRYFFTNLLKDDSKDRKFIANNPYPLDVEVMKICVAALRGENNFQNFVSMGSNVKTTIREVFECELTEVNPHEVLTSPELFSLPANLTNCYQFRISGNGFLKHMIRHLMMALWKVGNGKLTVDEFKELLKGEKNADKLWKVAHAKGLFLYRIQYE